MTEVVQEKCRVEASLFGMDVFEMQSTEGGCAVDNRLGHFSVDAEGTKEPVVELTLQFLTLHFCEICDGKGV